MSDKLFTEFQPVSSKQWKQHIQYELKGADSSQAVSDGMLAVAAGLALWFMAFLVWLRTRLNLAAHSEAGWQGEPHRSVREWLASIFPR